MSGLVWRGDEADGADGRRYRVWHYHAGSWAWCCVQGETMSGAVEPDELTARCMCEGWEGQQIAEAHRLERWAQVQRVLGPIGAAP